MNNQVNHVGNAFSELMKIRAGKPISADELNIIKGTPLFKTPFLVNETVTDVLAARAIAANDLWELRTGHRQKISIDQEVAAATCLGGTDATLKKNADGTYEPITTTPEFSKMVSITQPWETADHRYFLPHFNLPNLEKRVLNVLNCEATPNSVAKAVHSWNATDLDRAIADAHACGGIAFTKEEWLHHPQGQYLNSRPVVEITKIADAKPRSFSKVNESSSPLASIKVLDLTRILAGPTASLSLAEHGADVLMVTSPNLPQVPAFVRDTSHGKRSVFLDYTNRTQTQTLKRLAGDADIFVEGYRPGAMSRHGFSPSSLAKIHPGIIYVSVNCFGTGGPYASRAGWDQVAQAVTGMCSTQGSLTGAEHPVLAPVFMCDFLTGYLAAFGAMIALQRQISEGGSYHVAVSLCQSAMLLQREGITKAFETATGRLTPDKFEQYAVCDNDTIYGDLKSLGPAIKMSETPLTWKNSTPALGSAQAVWL